MLMLNADESFHFETLRQLGNATYHGADISEVLEAAGKLTDKGGDFEAFYHTFLELAQRVESFAERSSANAPSQIVSRRDAYFRASTYYRAADFYLHGDPTPDRINALWEKVTGCFDKAIALLPVPGRRKTLKSKDGSFEIPIIFYGSNSSSASDARPTVICGNGFDGAQEEMLHGCGFAVLERAWNFITYEGPGQPTVRRGQGLGFIPDWERVVTPVVNWLADNASALNVDMGKLGLWGQSMGGYLAPRAAAFEHRLAAVFAMDGVFDVGEAFIRTIAPPLKAAYAKGDKESFDTAAKELLVSDKTSTTIKWALSHGMWAMSNEDQPRSGYEMMQVVQKMTLEGCVDRIQCPVFVGDAEEDIFFKGQPEKLRDALGDRATFYFFSTKDGAGAHCQVGAGQYMAQAVFDWFEGVVSNQKK